MNNETEAKGFMDLALDDLSTAQILLDAGKYRAVVTHSYFAMFYAAKALLITRDFVSKKHGTILKQFSREFVNGDNFDYDIYLNYSNAINKRNKSSYNFNINFDKHEAQSCLFDAEEFVVEAKKFLK